MTQPPAMEEPIQKQKVRATRRTFLLQVLLPLLVGILILAAGIVLLWRGGVGTASAWADTSLIFLMLPWLCVGLLPMALIAALWYGVYKLTAWLPATLRQVRDYLDQAGLYLRKGSDIAVRPIFVVKGAWALMTTFFKGLASLIGIDDGETYG